MTPGEHNVGGEWTLVKYGGIGNEWAVLGGVSLIDGRPFVLIRGSEQMCRVIVNDHNEAARLRERVAALEAALLHVAGFLNMLSHQLPTMTPLTRAWKQEAVELGDEIGGALARTENAPQPPVQNTP